MSADGFDLSFFDENGKEYKAKSVTKCDYILLDPETGVKLPISRWAITQRLKLRPGKNNTKAKNKTRINWGNGKRNKKKSEEVA